MSLFCVEWAATVLSLSGAFVMSLKVGRYSELGAWPLWLCANFLLIYFFISTGQNGMLFGQGLGVISSVIGLASWLRTSEKELGNLAGTSFVFSVLGMLACVVSIIYSALNPSISSLEWVGAMFSATGAFLMASRHRWSPFAWIFWVIGNLVLSFTCWHQGQMGLLTLNITYCIINMIGVTRWILPLFQSGLSARIQV